MQLLQILKEMSDIKEDLKRSIIRSEMAYELYLKEKLFFKANRIYLANKTVYAALQEYIKICDLGELQGILEYTYHLEDWFMQFEYERMKIESPNTVFSFKSWTGSISFPKLVIEKLKQ